MGVRPRRARPGRSRPRDLGQPLLENGRV